MGGGADMSLEVIEVGYDDPRALALRQQLSAEYVARYGGDDATPVEPDEFAPPRGRFLVLTDDGVPVASGGVRLVDAGVAEIKRMYVEPVHRRQGLARKLLAELESSARQLGAGRVVLMTGLQQPEAIALYEATGYQPGETYGVYACAPDARFFAKPL